MSKKLTSVAVTTLFGVGIFGYLFYDKNSIPEISTLENTDADTNIIAQYQFKPNTTITEYISPNDPGNTTIVVNGNTSGIASFPTGDTGEATIRNKFNIGRFSRVTEFTPASNYNVICKIFNGDNGGGFECHKLHAGFEPKN